MLGLSRHTSVSGIRLLMFQSSFQLLTVTSLHYTKRDIKAADSPPNLYIVIELTYGMVHLVLVWLGCINCTIFYYNLLGSSVSYLTRTSLARIAVIVAYSVNHGYTNYGMV